MHLLLTSYYRECLVFKTKEDRAAFAGLQRSFRGKFTRGTERAVLGFSRMSGASRSGDGWTSNGYSLRIHDEIQGHHCCLLVQGSGHPNVRVEGEGSELSQFSCSAGDEVVGGKESGNRKPMRARVE